MCYIRPHMEPSFRGARPQDWLAIKALVQGVRRTMPGQWQWEAQLNDGLFVVVELRRTLVGAFLACPDNSPVAWVRVAALEDSFDAGRWLHLVLPPASAGLRQRGVGALAWIDYRGWASSYLPGFGFRQLTDVLTMAKFDDDLPRRSDAGVELRAAEKSDIPAIVAVDRSAFTPYWWNSAATLRRRGDLSSCFVVAEARGQVVGYVEGELQRSAAHINRIAVAPDCQARGIGSALLEHALLALWRAGAEHVTLNTQGDNAASLRLYHRFGFAPLGDRVKVWELPLAASRPVTAAE